MIDVLSIGGEILLTVPITMEAVSHEELMADDYIQLSWRSDKGDILPVGTHIVYEGEKYSLLTDYAPTRVNEAEYKYTPQFRSRIMRWQKTILPVYTYGDEGVARRELDWTFTGTPADAMYMVQQAILNETGEEWSVSTNGDFPETITISSQSSSIWAVLSDIAEQCDTEWYADKPSNYLYLGKCFRGAEVTLEVGRNVRMPSVTASQDEYFTRFYAFGSTRNVTKSEGVVMGSVINKRLTLDPTRYPNGYKDIRGHFEGGRFVSDLHDDEVFAIPLYFDDIYPSSKLTISDVRKRMRYHLDDNDNKIKIGGTEEEPEYSQYAIWYFQIPDFTFTEDLIIEGQELSVHFNSGQLRGREFKLAYHAEEKKAADKADVDKEFAVRKGEYEIIFDEQTEGFIIPSVDYLIPENENEIILFNINLPDEYKQSAMTELEAELDKEIAKRTADNNAYEFDSNPVAFHADKTNVILGQRVKFVNAGTSLDTRVMMVEKHLDFPFEQRIRVGNEVVVGSRQQLKDEVRNVGREVTKMRGQGTNISFIQRDHTRDLMRTMGRYFAMQDTLKMLEAALGGYSDAIDPITVRTMAMLVGDESLQFRFTQSREDLTPLDDCPVVYNAEKKQLDAATCSLIHLTLDIDDVTAKDVRKASDYKSWDMEEWHSEIFEDTDKAYYVYAKVPTEAGTVGSYDLSEKPVEMRSEDGFYHFLIGVLNPEYAETRELVTLYGFTAVLPAQVNTDLIRSADGQTYFDLARGEIGGIIKFKAGSEGLENIAGHLNIGNQNMLRNSGFTGDYLSEPLADETVMDASKKLYSDPLDHWKSSQGVTVVDEENATSGKAARIIADGNLIQTLYNKTIKGENYVVSFKAKGKGRLIVSLFDSVSIEIDSEDEYKRYEARFVPSVGQNMFSILPSADVIICDLQLERGTIATAWGMSPLDNSSDRTYYQALKYLSQALAGSTTTAGGLILTNLIQLGDQSNQTEFRERAGANGLYFNEDDTPAFWGGGTLEQAITTVSKYKNDPAYQPTNEELADMVQFVVTHGGKAILNEGIFRGTIYAQNGEFGGRLQLRFKEVSGEHTLTMADSSSIWLYGEEDDSVLTLPQNDAFDGWQLNVFAYPRISKMDGTASVAGRILCPMKSEPGAQYEASLITIENGGYLQFTYSKRVNRWILINDASNGSIYTKYEE